MPRRLKDEAICLYRMPVPDGGLERNVVDCVRPAFSQDLYALGIGAQIGQDDRVLFQGIGGSKNNAPLLCPSLGHSLNHNVNVPAVVQVLMRQDNSIQLGRVEFPPGNLDQGTRAGVKEYLSVAKAKPGASGSEKLANHDKPGTGGAQKGDGVSQFNHR